MIGCVQYLTEKVGKQFTFTAMENQTIKSSVEIYDNDQS